MIKTRVVVLLVAFVCFVLMGCASLDRRSFRAPQEAKWGTLVLDLSPPSDVEVDEHISLRNVKKTTIPLTVGYHRVTIVPRDRECFPHWIRVDIRKGEPDYITIKRGDWDCSSK